MRLDLNPFFTHAHGKLDPSHDKQNMCFTRNGVTYSRKVCNPRDITKNPYSASEQQNMTLFRQAWAAVKTTLEDADAKADAQARFRANPGKYTTVAGFLFAENYKRLKAGE